MNTQLNDRLFLAANVKEDFAREKEACMEYRHFFKFAWHELEPTTPLQWNWHIDVLCDEMQKQAERIAARQPKEYDIIINIMRRSLKSRIDNVFFVPWVWTRWPWMRFLTASYSMDLALGDSVDSRTLIDSGWYQRHWGGKYKMVGDQNVKSFYKNNRGGYRRTTSVGIGGAGKGGDILICDDPIDPTKAASAVELQNCVYWYTKSFFSSLNNKNIGVRIIIMQRVAESDLSGYLLQYFPGDYKLFCIPGELTPNVSPPELKHYYSKTGLFFPDRMSREILDEEKRNLGDSYAAQVLQDPSSPEGGMFKREYWKFWRPAGSNLPEVQKKIGDTLHIYPVIDLPGGFFDQIDSWDMALKPKKENDFCAGHSYARTATDFFLLDRVHEHLTALEKEDRVIELKNKHSGVSALLIEDATGGSDTIQYLQARIPGVIGITPRGNKRARAQLASRYAQSGNLYLPHPAIAPWVWDFIDLFAAFRGLDSDEDDDIDAMSQAINYFCTNKRVLQDFTGETSDFSINWENLDLQTRVIISQWMERDQMSEMIFAIWNPEVARLHVFGEMRDTVSVPEKVKTNCFSFLKKTSNGIIKDFNRIQWYGSPLMFSSAATGDIASAYSRAGINLQEIPQYDEMAGIMRLNRLFFRARLEKDKTKRAIKIHHNCDHLSQQLLAWSFDDNNRPEKEYGLCRSLCLIASELFETLKKPKKRDMAAVYTPSRTSAWGKIEKAMKSGDYKTLYGRRANEEPGGKYDWMKT